MNRHAIYAVFVASLVATLGACSHGQGPADSSSSNVPAAQPPTAPPEVPPAQPPALPPVETLTCNPCKKIVFMSMRDGNSEIYSVNADGTELTRLTDDDSYDGDPAWSPDGRHIAFTSDRDHDGDNDAWPREELYVMDADGGNVQQLTFSKSGAWSPSWSPDGSRIAYETLSDGSGNIWEISAEGGTPKLLFSLPGWDGQPAWSPDGTRLALVSDWFAYDFVTDVFLTNTDGSGMTALTDGNILDQVNYEDPAWSPDGGRIALTVSQRLGTFEYVSWLGVVNANGSGLTWLTTPGGTSLEGIFVSSPSWSPDGTMIAYTSCGSDRCDVSWFMADGSARGTIITNGWNPDWQR